MMMRRTRARRAPCLAGVLALATASPALPAADTAEAHVAAARAAAGSDYTSVFDDVCFPPAPAAAGTPAQAAAVQPATVATPPRSAWHVEPVQVFDNLYYLGQSEFSAWAVRTSAGIIVIDALFEYSVEDEIVNGLSTLGLDPATIKYVIVSHAHRDHAAGARLLQQRFGAHVIMSAADWDYMAADRQAWPKPRRDLIATDGEKLTLGDTTLTLYLTPGHTPGTVSTLIPVTDHGQRHVVAEWGGTGMEFRNFPDAKAYWFQTYSRSIQHFRAAANSAGADVQIANHPNQDNAHAKLAALAKRRNADPHPFVIGAASVDRYLDMLDQCAQAGLARTR